MAFLPEVEDWVAEVTSSSVTLKIHFLEGANPNNTDWKWFFYRKDPGQTGQYDKSLNWSTTKVDGTTYYTITISGLSANTKYVGRLTDVDHKNDSETLFTWTTKPPPDPYVSSVVSNAAGELTITVANRNDKGVVFKCAPPVNSSYDLRKTSTAWQDSFTFTNCYYGQTYYGGAEITDYTLENKTAKVQGTCSVTGAQKGTTLTVSYTVTDNGNYTEWSLDNINWYSVNTAIDATFSTYGDKPGRTAYFRAVVSNKVVTNPYTITTDRVELTQPATQTITIYHYNYDTNKPIYTGYTTQTVNKGGSFDPDSNTGVFVPKCTYFNWGYDLNSIKGGSITNITQDITIFYFYKYNALSATSSVSQGKITITTSNGIGPFSYYISPYNENAVHKYENKSESSYTFPQYPYGRTYHIKIKDAYDTYELNVANSAGEPTITKTGQTFNETTGKYNVNVSIIYKGYENVSFNKTATINENTATVNSCAYNDTITATFSYVWNSKLTLTDTASLTLSLTQPYSYTYTLSAYYVYQETLFNSFDNGTLYSLSTEVSAPSPSAYPAYIGYSITNPPSGQSSSGSSNKVKIRTDGKSVIVWKYRKDSYPYTLEQWYYNEDGEPVQYKGPDGKNPPYDRPFNLEDVAPISGNLTGKGALVYYTIGTNTEPGDGSFEYEIDLSDYKNQYVVIKAYYQFNLRWVKKPSFVAGTNKLQASWTGGRAGYRFEYFTNNTHHYYPGPDGFDKFTSYPKETKDYYNLPGGFQWTVLLTDRAQNTLSETIYSKEVPEGTITLDITDIGSTLKANISAFANSGYSAVRLEYKRTQDTNWKIAESWTHNAQGKTLEYNLDNDVSDLNNNNTTFSYDARIVWYDTECDTNNYAYEYEIVTEKPFILGYAVNIMIHENIKNLYIDYTGIIEKYTPNKQLDGYGTTGNENPWKTHTLKVQYESAIKVIRYDNMLGWVGHETFDIPYGGYAAISGPATYRFKLTDEVQAYQVYFSSNTKKISSYEIECYQQNGDTYKLTTIKIPDNDINPISIPVNYSTFYLNSWTLTPEVENIVNAQTLTPQYILDENDRKSYNAANFVTTAGFHLDIDYNKVAFTAADGVECTLRLTNGGNMNTESVTLKSSTENNYYEFTEFSSSYNQVYIEYYTLTSGHKYLYIQENTLYAPKRYLASNTNTFSIEIGKKYIIGADEYQMPRMVITPGKYDFTLDFTGIDEEVFNETTNPHKIIIKQGEEEVLEKTFYFTGTSAEIYVNGIENNVYKLKANTTYDITVKLWDAYNNRECTKFLTDTISTLARTEPIFTIPSNDKIGNRFTATLDNYEDFNKVYFYVWADNADFTPETNILVADNLSANVSSAFVPSEGNFALNKDYWIKIKLWATDGSSNTWTSDTLSFHTPSAYTVSLDLKNINKINAQSGANAAITEYANGTSIAVIPNDTFTITGVTEYSSLTTPNTDDGRKMQYKHPVTYKLVNSANNIVKSGTFISDSNITSPISYQMTNDTPALTLTLIATPADWDWPKGYTSIDGTNRTKPILTTGIPTTDFKHSVWNELMFYIKKWAEYKNKLNSWDMMSMSANDTILTKERYNNAYDKLTELFNALSDIIPEITEGAQVAVTAKGIKAFGDTIKYENLK